jgi:lactoylglutathione lyase
MIRSAKMDEALAFYRALGCEFVREQHGNGPVHHSCSVGPMVFEIYPGEAGQAVNRNQAGATMLGFTVPNLDSILGRLADAGIEVLTPAKKTQWGVRATVADPDGRAVNIAEAIA